MARPAVGERFEAQGEPKATFAPHQGRNRREIEINRFLEFPALQNSIGGRRQAKTPFSDRNRESFFPLSS